MGQSTTVATAFTAIMMIAGVTILITTAVSGFSIITQAIDSRVDATQTIVHERMTFTGWKLDDAQTLRLNVTNAGETSMTLREFDKFDMIVTYIEAGATRSEWLALNQEASSGDYWKIVRVFFNGAEGDQVNPMVLTTPVSGNWDHGETIELLVHIDAVSPTYSYVVYSTPNGVTASTDLTLSYQSGTTSIASGSVFVEVSHNLGRVPVNIQVTPRNEITGICFWVSDVDSDSFRINLSLSEAGAIGFYWRIE
ncbi:hypothetical protein E2P71_05455 [Candidatus Bathyarchaeota archaeon]|nr:hypothetical protein E2P71_05455 [Candidatus Bathyarchaeota archaeon]